jgi:hypothetical protein
MKAWAGIAYCSLVAFAVGMIVQANMPDPQWPDVPSATCVWRASQYGLRVEFAPEPDSRCDFDRVQIAFRDVLRHYVARSSR